MLNEHVLVVDAAAAELAVRVIQRNHPSFFDLAVGEVTVKLRLAVECLFAQ